MVDLDNLSRYGELDPDDMLGRIAELPQQCRRAWALAQDLKLPADYGRAEHVVILGMGGSAIGGALLAELAASECGVPITVVRGYNLPAFAAGPACMTVGSSYSGNTEETLVAFEEAAARGNRLLALTTGGRLAELARARGVPVVAFDYRSAPRAAIGYSFTLLLGLLCRLGLLDDQSANLDEAIVVMEAWQEEIRPEVPAMRNPAKQLARQLMNRLPVVYGAGFLAAVANRWKTQFNENSKQWAFFEVLPELNHNAVLGYEVAGGVRERVMVLLLRSSLDHPRVRLRWEVTEELLRREGVRVDTIEGRGEGRLAQMLSLTHFGDYVSFYLALLNGVDPSPVPAIKYLKQRLAEM